MKINRLAWVGIVIFGSLLVFFYGIRFLQEETFQKFTSKFIDIYLGDFFELKPENTPPFKAIYDRASIIALEELERRLRERKADSAAQMEIRVATARHEMDQSDWFDFIVINETDELANTVTEIIEIVTAEQYRPESRAIHL